MASQRRQHRRDVLKRRCTTGTRAAVVREHLPAGILSTSSSTPLSQPAVGAPTAPLPGAICEAPAVSPEVLQLRQENAFLRHQLDSRNSCPKVETPAQDQIRKSEVDWKGLTGDRAMITGRKLTNAAHRPREDSELRKGSANSASTYHGASPTTALPEDGFRTDKIMEQTLWVAANRPTRPDGWAARPDPTSPATIFHTDPFSIEGFDGLLDEPLQPFTSSSGCFTSPLGKFASPPGHFTSHPAPANIDLSRATGQHSWSQSQAQQCQTDCPWSRSHAQQPCGPAEYVEQPHFSRGYSPGSENHADFGQGQPPSYEDHPPYDAFDHYILPDVPGGFESVDQLAVHIPFWPQLLGSPQIAAGEP